MKKSQVLAALALAFALGLGVVAPVANTYATVIYPQGTTQEQKDALKADVKAANKAYNELEKVNEYLSLVDVTDGIVEALKADNTAVTNLYNSGVWKAIGGSDKGRANVNDAITYFNDTALVETDDASKNGTALYNYTMTNNKRSYNHLKTNIDINQARLIEMPEMKEVEDVSAAYTNVENLLAIAKNNKEILAKNYVTGHAAVDAARGMLSTIIESSENWLIRYRNIYSTVWGTAVEVYASNNLKSADENAYKTLVDSAAWKNAADSEYNASKTRFELFVNAAKSTPKYEFVEDLAEAKKNFEKINSSEAVDYDKALQYIAAFNTAIANFKNGTVTPAPTETRTFTSADGNVTVSGKLPAGLVVKVAAKTEDKVAAFGDKAYKMWDISLANADGTAYNLDGKTTITVSIKVPAGINGEKAGIYFVDAKGNVQNYKATYANNTLTFTTNHLSLWAIVEDNGKVITTPEAPTTGIVSNEGNASTTVAMVAGLATALTAAGAGVVAYRNARRSTRK